MGGWSIARVAADSTQQWLMVNHILEPGQSIVVTEEPANLLADGGPEAIDANTLFANDIPWLTNSGGACN